MRSVESEKKSRDFSTQDSKKSVQSSEKALELSRIKGLVLDLKKNPYLHGKMEYFNEYGRILTGLVYRSETFKLLFLFALSSLNKLMLIP